MEVGPAANAVLHIVFILLVAVCVLPVLLIIIVSFTPEALITRDGYSFFPAGLSLYNYRFLFRQPGVVLRAYGMTISITVSGTILSTLCIALYAYPLSRRSFPYRGAFTVFMFITMIFSGGLVPYYVTMNNLLKLSNTVWALLLPLLFNPFWCVVMRTFYQQTVPDALVESAKLDGAGEYQTFFRIIMPISLPGLATIALFMFVIYWNDYYQAMLFLTTNEAKDSLQTMQYLCYRALSSINFLRTQAASLGVLSAKQLRDMPNEGYRMTIAVVTMAPLLVIYPFFQKYFVQGLTIGAVKG